MTELDTLTLGLIRRAGGVTVVHLPKARGGGQLHLTADRELMIGRHAIERLVAAGVLTRDPDGSDTPAYRVARR